MQTLADKENDAHLWSKTPMQRFRIEIDAQVHLDGLFNDLNNYLEGTNQTLKKATENPSHGKSSTNCEWRTEGISQSKAANVENNKIRSEAAARLHRSARDIRSWTPAYDGDGSKEGQSTWKNLVRTFVTSVQDLETENQELTYQLAKMRQDSTMMVGSTISPVTLRTIIMMRVMEANFGPPTTRVNDQNLLFSDIGKITPIHIGALDVTLTPDRANQLGLLLPSGTVYRDIYDGIYIHTCTKCLKPRFRLNKTNRYPLFCGLNEYPKLGDMLSYGTICSSCGLDTLLRAIWRDWWHNLGSLVWLKHDWDQNCCFFDIMHEADLVSILDSLGCQDINSVNEYIKRYPLLCLVLMRVKLMPQV